MKRERGGSPWVLAIDIGNTNITLGAFPARPPAGGGVPRARATGRLSTHRHTTADEYGLSLRQVLDHAGLALKGLRGVVVASVVPPLDEVFRDLCPRYLGRPALFVGPETRTGVEIRYDRPTEVGADRIVNAAAAFARFRRACIVIDFGTATTFDCVDGRGAYLGGAIAPGPQMAAESLSQRTAKLPLLGAFRKPGRAIGKNTLDSMASGLYHGYVGLSEGILARLKAEMGGAPLVLATGGLSPLLGKEIGGIKEIVPNLTLEGLWLIWRLNQGKK